LLKTCREHDLTLGIDAVAYDSGHDGLGVYEYLLENSIAPVITLNPRTDQSPLPTGTAQHVNDCRADDMIVCAGNKIAGPDVENVLIQHPAVKEAAGVASPDELRGFVPKAFIVLAEGYTPQDELAAELQEFVKARIAPF
jgi:acyl-CoA synthetase (AMP-forming)/AMP-acid ligase II